MLLSKKEIEETTSKIVLRADSLPSIEEIQGTYVDTGVINRVVNINHQVIFGRRGTGKTHLLNYACPKLEISVNNGTCIYIDARNLSGASDVSRAQQDTFEQRYIIVKSISNMVFKHLSEYSKTFKAYKNRDKLLAKIKEACSGLQIEKIPVRSIEKNESQEGVTKSANVGFKNINFEMTGKANKETKEINAGETEYTHNYSKSMKYSDLSISIRDLLEELDIHLFVIIDEWSFISLNMQPYIADFVKRVFLSIKKVTLKIGAIKTRTNLINDKEGIELSADIASSINLDDYFIFDREPIKVTNTFEEIIYRHFTHSLSASKQFKTNILSSTKFRDMLFTTKPVFIELTIAAEGVIRDFINIFSKCVYACNLNDKEKICSENVRRAASSWYRLDKRENLDEKEKELLNYIVGLCIKHKVRAFIAPLTCRENRLLEKLIDKRTIHLLASDTDIGMEEFDLYTIDFGVYGDLNKNSNLPAFRMTQNQTGNNSTQPFSGDKRWISYIKLDANLSFN